MRIVLGICDGLKTCTRGFKTFTRFLKHTNAIGQILFITLMDLLVISGVQIDDNTCYNICNGPGKPYVKCFIYFTCFLHDLVAILSQLSPSICASFDNLYAMAVVSFRYMVPPAVANLGICRRLLRRKSPMPMKRRFSFWQRRRWMLLACTKMPGQSLATAWALEYLVERPWTGSAVNFSMCYLVFGCLKYRWLISIGERVYTRYTYQFHDRYIHISSYSV